MWVCCGTEDIHDEDSCIGIPAEAVLEQQHLTVRRRHDGARGGADGIPRSGKQGLGQAILSQRRWDVEEFQPSGGGGQGRRGGGGGDQDGAVTKLDGVGARVRELPGQLGIMPTRWEEGDTPDSCRAFAIAADGRHALEEGVQMAAEVGEERRQALRR